MASAGRAKLFVSDPPASVTTATTLMKRKLRRRPSMVPSQRVMRNSAVANDTEAPSAHSTPAPTSAQRPAMSPLLP
ncbi:hypothetical protein D3C83_120010 [compost metagenome]